MAGESSSRAYRIAFAVDTAKFQSGVQTIIGLSGQMEKAFDRVEKKFGKLPKKIKERFDVESSRALQGSLNAINEGIAGVQEGLRGITSVLSTALSQLDANITRDLRSIIDGIKGAEKEAEKAASDFQARMSAATGVKDKEGATKAAPSPKPKPTIAATDTSRVEVANLSALTSQLERMSSVMGQVRDANLRVADSLTRGVIPALKRIGDTSDRSFRRLRLTLKEIRDFSKNTGGQLDNVSKALEHIGGTGDRSFRRLRLILKEVRSSSQQVSAQFERVAQSIEKIGHIAERSFRRLRLMLKELRSAGTIQGGPFPMMTAGDDVLSRLDAVVKRITKSYGAMANRITNMTKTFNKSQKPLGDVADLMKKYQKNVISAKEATDNALNAQKKRVSLLEREQARLEKLRSSWWEPQIRLREKMAEVTARLSKERQVLTAIEKRGVQALKEDITLQDKLLSRMKTTFGRLGLFTLAASSIWTFVSAVREANRVLVEIEHGLAQFQKVLGENVNLDKLQDGFFSTAQKLGLGVEKVISAGKVFAQQGLSQVEVLQLTETAMKAVTAADLDEKQAVEALTAARKLFNIEAADSITVIDKLAAVQRRHAVTAKDLADSIRILGPVVKTVGGDIDDVIGVTTALVAVTRKSGKEVANSLKTIFARFASPTTRDVFLSQAGVDVMSDPSTFKPLMVTLKDLASSWSNLTNAQKVAVAQAAGAKRRWQDFIVLMENFPEVLTAAERSMGAAGEATKITGFEVETLKRRAISMKVAWDELTTTFAQESGAVAILKGLATSLTFIFNKVTAITKSVPLLGPLLSFAGAIAGAAAFHKLLNLILVSVFKFDINTKSFVKRFSDFIGLTELSKRGLNAISREISKLGPLIVRFAVHPWAGVVAAIGATAAGAALYGSRIKELQSGEHVLNDLEQSFKDLGSATSDARIQLEDYLRGLEGLRDAQNRGKFGRGEQVPNILGFNNPGEIKAAQEAIKALAQGRQSVLESFFSFTDVRGNQLTDLPLELFESLQQLEKATKGEFFDLKDLGSEAFGRSIDLTAEDIRSQVRDATTKLNSIFGQGALSPEAANVFAENIFGLLGAQSVDSFVEQFDLSANQKTILANTARAFREALGTTQQTSGSGKTRTFGGFDPETIARLGEAVVILGRINDATKLLQGLQDKSTKFKGATSAFEEQSDVFKKLKDHYFEILSPLDLLLDGIDKQAEVFFNAGLAMDTYEQKANRIRSAISELAKKESDLKIEVALATRNLERFEDELGDRSLSGQQQRDLAALVDKVKIATQELEKFEKSIGGGSVSEIATDLLNKIEPDRRRHLDSKRHLATLQSTVRLIERQLRADQAVINIRATGQAQAENAAEQERQAVELAQTMFEAKKQVLDAQFNELEVSADVYQQRLLTLETERDEAIAIADINRQLSERQRAELRIRKDKQRQISLEEHRAQMMLKVRETEQKIGNLQRFGTEEARRQSDVLKQRQALIQAEFEGQKKILDNKLNQGLTTIQGHETSLDELELTLQKKLTEEEINAVLKSRLAPAQRLTDHANFVRDTIKETLADWESLSSGEGLKNALAAIGRRQREVFSEALARKLPDKLGTIFQDPILAILEKEKGTLMTLAQQIEQAHMRGAQKAVAIMNGQPVPTFGSNNPNNGTQSVSGFGALSSFAAFAGGLSGTALSRAMGGNAAMAQTGGSLATMLAMGLGATNPFLLAGAGIMGALFGGIFGGGEKPSEIVEENTRALKDNTQAMSDLAARIISAPSTFVAPAVKGQASGATLNVTINQAPGMSADDVVNRINSEFVTSTARTGDRGRLRF